MLVSLITPLIERRLVGVVDSCFNEPFELLDAFCEHSRNGAFVLTMSTLVYVCDCLCLQCFYDVCWNTMIQAWID